MKEFALEQNQLMDGWTFSQNDGYVIVFRPKYLYVT